MFVDDHVQLDVQVVRGDVVEMVVEVVDVFVLFVLENQVLGQVESAVLEVYRRRVFDLPSERGGAVKSRSNWLKMRSNEGQTE